MALAVECVGHRVGPLHTIPWRLALLAGIGVLVLGLAGYGALLYGWWIPVVPQCSPGGCPGRAGCSMSPIRNGCSGPS